MTLETAQFLSSAAGIPQERERLWMWCPNPYHGQRTDFIFVSHDGDVTTWVCPDCGRVVEVDKP